MNWILLIAIYAADGKYLDKIAVPMSTARSCMQARAQLTGYDHVKVHGVCITKDHWEGRKQQPGVNLD